MIRRPAYVRTGGRMGGSFFPKPKAKKKRRTPIGIFPWAKDQIKNNINLGFRGMARGPGSMTRYSATRKMDVSVKPVGTGSTYSYYKYTCRPQRGSRIIKSQAAPLYSTYNAGQRITSSQGQQSYTTSAVFLPSTLRTLYLESSANTDGSFWVDQARCKWMFQNQSEANTFLTLYEFVARRDSNVGPSLAFSSGMTAIQAGGTSTADDIGATPFMTTRFTQNFKILKKFNVELAQGRTHIHTSMYYMSKNYREAMYEMDTGDTVYAGWTRGLFIICNGSPYNSAATKTNVSTTPVAIDLVTSFTYKTHPNLANKATFEVQTDFPTFADGQIIDIGSGEADTVTDA